MPSGTYQLTDKDVLYFLHIPKTAGTSFTDILKAHFAPEELSFSRFIQDFIKLPPDQIANFKVVSGHYFYNISTFIPRSPVYITMLRDPIERAISKYAMLQRMTSHYAHDIVKSQSLLEFATDPRTLPLYANSQTRYIAADPNAVEIRKTLPPEERDTFELWRRMENYAPNGYSDPELLERAKERLQNFAFVGLTEQFDEAIEVLCYTFGWPVPPAPKVLNVSPNRPAHSDIPQEVIDIIRENTQLDAALYQTGKQLFDAHYNQMLKDHPEKIKQNVSLDSATIANMQRQIDFQKRLIETLQQEKMHLEDQWTAMQRGYDNSVGWRFVLRFNNARKKLIPEGSKREEIYKKIRDRLA